MSQSYRTAPVPHEGYPPGIGFIVGNEAAERFSFYGMKVLLTFYFRDVLLYTDNAASGAVHLFVTAVYLTPLLGAMISDRFLGKYNTIMALSVVYCLGHLVLALTEWTQLGAWLNLTDHQLREYGMIGGLGLIALGAGGIKPCVSAHVGDQFAKGEEKKLEKIFSLFYFMINFGAGFSTLLMPVVRKHWGHGWAFGIPGILMAVATFVFWLGRHRFVHVPPSGPNPNSFWRVVYYALTNQKKKPVGGTWLDAARGRFEDSVITGVRAAVGVLGVFAFIFVFWMLQDQIATTWTLQAKKMNLQILAPGTISLPWLSDGVTLTGDQVQALNPFLVMLLIPIMTYGVYPWLGRLGFEMTPLRRMSAGMLCSFISFVMAGIIQIAIDRGHTLSVLWQIPGYTVITLAEVMVSITGLEFAYTQAPKSMKSTLMSFWLITVAFGNLLFTPFLMFSNWLAPHLSKIGITGLEVKKDQVTATNFFMFAAVMLLAGILFTLNARRYKPVNFLESAEPANKTEPAVQG